MPAAAAQLKEVRQVEQKGRCLQCLRSLDSLKGSGEQSREGLAMGLDSFQTGAEDSNWFVSSLQKLEGFQTGISAASSSPAFLMMYSALS